MGWCGELPLVAESDGGQLVPWRSDRTTREQLSPVPCCPAAKYVSLAVRTHESLSAHPIMSDAPNKLRTANKGAAKDRVRSQGPGLVGPASFAPVRPATGSQCARGPKTKTPRPQERCWRQRGTERVPSPAPLFHSFPSCMRTRKKAGTGEGSCPIACQNSSIAPGTVCTMRLARCAGSAL